MAHFLFFCKGSQSCIQCPLSENNVFCSNFLLVHSKRMNQFVLLPHGQKHKTNYRFKILTFLLLFSLLKVLSYWTFLLDIFLDNLYMQFVVVYFVDLWFYWNATKRRGDWWPGSFVGNQILFVKRWDCIANLMRSLLQVWKFHFISSTPHWQLLL